MKKIFNLAILLSLFGCNNSTEPMQTENKPEENQSIVEIGQCIVAKPEFPSPMFKDVVILVLQKERGTIAGVIINKTSEDKLGDLMSEYEGSNLSVSHGGPVQKDEAAIWIHKFGDKLVGARQIMSNLYSVGNLDVIKDELKSNKVSENDIRFFNGFVSWKEEQFASEYNNDGVWYIMDVNQDDIMSSETSKLWEKLVNQIK